MEIRKWTFERAVAPRFSSLNSQNVHPRDTAIVFDEGAHLYTVNGNRAELSVTGFKELFTYKFNGESIVAKAFSSPTQIWEHPPEQKHLEKVVKPGNGHHGKTRYELLQWGNAAERGTMIHKRIEDFLESRTTGEFAEILAHPQAYKHCFEEMSQPDDSRETKCLIHQAAKFLVEFFKLGWVPYRTEWRVWHNHNIEHGPGNTYNILLAGSIDAVFQKVDNPKELCIVDWKVSDKTFTQRPYMGNDPFYLPAPFDSLENTKLNQYAIQLETYSYMIEENYEMNIASSWIVQLKPGLTFNTNYVKYQISNLRKEVEHALRIYYDYMITREALKRWDVWFLRNKIRKIGQMIPDVPHPPFYEDFYEYTHKPTEYVFSTDEDF